MRVCVCVSEREREREREQAWEFRMEKSAEKWGTGGRRRPPVGVQRATPLVVVRGRSTLKLKLKLFNKNKT